MSIWGIDIPKMVRDLAPPKKRSAEDLALREGLASAFGRTSKAFQEYKEGSAAGTWSGTANKYDQIVFNNSVYECIADTTSATPDTAPQDWLLILDNARGSDETQMYNSGILSLEWALNKRFGLTFNQPPTASDIYIQTNTPVNTFFRVGDVESISSAVFDTTSSEFVQESATIGGVVMNYTIYFPVVDYLALGADAETIVRNFVDRYNAYSITYDIQTY